MGFFMKYILIFIIFITNTFIWANPSFFDDSNIKNKKLLSAIELYQGLEFEKAEKLLIEVSEKTDNRLEKATAFKYLAFLFTLKQNDDKSELYFSKLFDIYPDFALDYTTVTPKISEFFKAFHEIWLRTPGSKFRIYPLNIKKITYDAGIKLKVEWHDPNLEIRSVILKYKQSGDSKYSQIKKRDLKVNNNLATFNLSFLNDPTINFTLDYYIEVYDYDEKLIQKINDEKNPKSIKVNVPGGSLSNYDGSSKSAWYKSTWFITTMTVLAVGAIGGGTYFLLQSTTQGGPSDAQINIYITNGN
jgi:hypothetical protein